jgi:hypothetical protein
VYDTDNGLSKIIEAGDIEIRVTYRPTDLLVLQELGHSNNVDTELVDQLRRKYSPRYYFVVSFSRSNNEILAGSANFSELLQTISFRMHDVISLRTSSNHAIPLADFVYNRTFGLSNSTDLLCVFEKSEIINSDWIDVDIEEFGLGIGKRSIRFDVSKMEEAPKLFKK